MQFGHAIHLVGSHEAQVGHANSLLDLVRENRRVRHDFQQIGVVLESILNELHEVPIDVTNDLHDSIRKQFTASPTQAANAP